GWRIGSGSHPLTHYDKDPDLTAVTENVVDRAASPPRLRKKVLVPASSIKGALVHRLLFHFSRRKGIWAEDRLPKNLKSLSGEQVDQAMLWSWQDDPDFAPIIQLLGSAKHSGNANGLAGALYIDDIYLDMPNAKQLAVQPHNAMDSFTGGARNRMLFSEELLTNQKLSIVMSMEQRCYEALDKDLQEALHDTLEDLAHGRLALGAAAGRGHGFFHGSVEHFTAPNSGGVTE
ncbi:MAG: RAMP superfamily CRISPR-associated protein, partial [Candidatus Igneacidithiobacillus chanchocoensis]